MIFLIQPDNYFLILTAGVGFRENSIKGTLTLDLFFTILHPQDRTRDMDLQFMSTTDSLRNCPVVLCGDFNINLRSGLEDEDGVYTGRHSLSYDLD